MGDVREATALSRATVIPPELITVLSAVGVKRLATLPARAKYPPPKGWAEPENQLSPDDPDLLALLKRGGNYAVIGGRGLVLMDTDDPETEAIAQTLPPTFTVQSGGKGTRYHRYYRTDLEKTIPLRKVPAPGEKKRGYGELRAGRSYVVGPGSVHPETGTKYLIADPQPLAFVPEAQLREAFKDYIPEDAKPETKPPQKSTVGAALTVLDVCNAYGVQLKKQGSELRGRNPTHGDNVSSLAVNPGKNVWRCHPCQSGGGPLELIAVLEGVISCDQAHPGALRGEDFKKTLEAAQESGLLKRGKEAQTPPVPQLIPGHKVVRAGEKWVLLEGGEKDKPLLAFEALGSMTAKKIAKTLKIEVDIAERQLAALSLYQETKNALKAQREAKIAKKRTEEIEAGGYDRYLDFDKWGNAVKCYYDILVRDLIEEFTLITFTDIEDTWIYDAEAKIYRDTGVSTVKTFIRKALGEFFRKSFAEETIYQLKIATYVTRKDMVPPEELLNLRNGLLNIKNRDLLPHTTDWFFLSCSPTVYDPEAEAPEFKKLLAWINCLKEKTLQEFSGCLLLSTPKYKKAGFIYGPTDGAKTTWTNAILNVIGPDAVCGIAIQNLDLRFQSQRLYGKKVNMCGDLGAEVFSRIAMFKRTTGGDILESEIKGKNKPLSFIWNGKHLFDANDLPKAVGEADTDAFYNRLLLFPFSRVVPKNQIDRDLPSRLAAETSGILNWMLEGLDRLEANKGFTDQTDIEEIKAQYKRAADSVYCFAIDCCEIIQGKYVPKMESHRLYAVYCIAQGFSARGRTKFYEELQINLPGIVTDRRKVGTETPQVWMNLQVKDYMPPRPEGALTDFPTEPGQKTPDPLQPTKDTNFTIVPATLLPTTPPHTTRILLNPQNTTKKVTKKERVVVKGASGEWSSENCGKSGKSGSRGRESQVDVDAVPKSITAELISAVETQGSVFPEWPVLFLERHGTLHDKAVNIVEGLRDVGRLVERSDGSWEVPGTSNASPSDEASGEADEPHSVETPTGASSASPSKGADRPVAHLMEFMTKMLSDAGDSIGVILFYNELQRAGYHRADAEAVVRDYPQFVFADGVVSLCEEVHARVLGVPPPGEADELFPEKKKNLQNSLATLLNIFHEYPGETLSEETLLGILEDPHGIDPKTGRRLLDILENQDKLIVRARPGYWRLS